MAGRGLIGGVAVPDSFRNLARVGAWPCLGTKSGKKSAGKSQGSGGSGDKAGLTVWRRWGRGPGGCVTLAGAGRGVEWLGQVGLG